MTAREISARTLGGLGGALLLLGIGMRINNALRFRVELGFDAAGNLEYLQHLQSSWSLPSPELLWSASHPPFFYYAAAAFWRGLSAIGLDGGLLPSLPLLLSAIGLLTVAAGMTLVRRADPDDGLRALVAGALVLFLPVHLYMSPMIGEEVLLSALVAWVVVLAASRAPGLPGAAETALVGLLCGLALLTKLSGILVAAAVVFTWLLAARSRGQWSAALSRSALLAGVVLAVGGWFYLNNWISHGYLYPQDLAIHQGIFDFPPGERGVLDYLRFPLATFTDPQLLNPDLLRSVWGSTYATVFFDGHRHFLPNSVGASRVGGAILLLALLPTAAFLVGLARGAARAIAEPGGRDTLLIALVACSLAGYVVFTWGNPWFVTLKGSYLLGLCVPFAFYASEVLAGWLRGPGPASKAVAAALLALVVLVAAAFTIGPVFDKRDRGVRKERQSTPAARAVPASPESWSRPALGAGAGAPPR